MNEVALGEAIEPHPKAEQCREQLTRILRSSDFSASEREHRVLTYIVEETLAGRSAKIKAYTIAIEVFGREPSFDAQNDPIVRIAAAHLRRALERYYLTAGKLDPIVITVPKGCYVPMFAWRATPALDSAPALDEPETAELPEPQPRMAWRALIAPFAAATLLALTAALLLPWIDGSRVASPEVPHILVTKLEDLTKAGSSAALANGLTQEIIGQLSKFKEIVVMQATEDGSTAGPLPRFVLAGSVDLSPEAFHLRIRFVDRESGSVLWANTFDGELKASDLVHAQTDISSNVATALAQSYGVIFQADAMRMVANAPDDWTAYSCTLSFYTFRATLDRSTLPAVRECLEKAVARFPDYATAWAMLAQVSLDEIRFRFPYDPVAVAADLETALDTARHAVQLDPYNTRGLQAEMFALFLSKQFEAGKKVGKKALELNPNDTDLMGEFGYRLALSGDWNEGCPLIARARERNPGPLGHYESGLALCSYFAGETQDAVMWITKTAVPKNPLYHLIATAILAEAGQTREAAEHVAWLCEKQPELVKTVRQQVTMRLNRRADIEMFLKSLAKAGLSDAGQGCGGTTASTLKQG